MISVQSHLQRSSGSNWLWCIAVFVVLFSSCGTQKRTTRTSTRTKTVRVTKPKDKKTTRPTKDSNRDVVKTKEDLPPVQVEEVTGEDPSTGIFKKDVYNITYLLPLKSTNYTRLSSKNEKFIQYFAGMEMAEAILEREGINLNIQVVDSEKKLNSTNLERYIDENTDAIVGLYDSKDLKEAAAYAKRKKIPLVSPWKASSKIASKNPYYVQLRPNLDEYYRTMVEDITEKYKPEQVYILRRGTDTDKKMARYIQYYGKSKLGTSGKPFNEFEVSVDSLAYGEAAFDYIFNPNETNVVVIPHFSFAKDEAFIYGCTRRLTVEKGPAKMVVYGMEILLDSDKIAYDHYKALNVNVARTKFVDEGDGDVNRFKRKFLEIYGCLPNDDAYEGYDNLMYVGRNLHEYGKNFQHYLSNDNGYYLQAAYDVQPTYEKNASDDFENINYFENKHVDIITFDGTRFRRVIK